MNTNKNISENKIKNLNAILIDNNNELDKLYERMKKANADNQKKLDDHTHKTNSSKNNS